MAARNAPVDVGLLFSKLFAPELHAWRGKASLGHIFWEHGVAVSSLLIMLNFLAFDRAHWGVLQVLILVDLAYTAWILVAIWRCSANASPFWGALARWLTIAWGLNATLVLFFLELELVLRHASQ